MIGSIILLAVLATIAYTIAQARRPPGGGAPGPDLRQAVVRLFRLGLLTAAVVLVAEGVAGLVAEAWPQSGELSRDPAALARPLAFTVVGVPVLVGLAAWQRRQLAGDPDEETSGGWLAYLTLVLGIALLLSVVAVDLLLGWLLTDDGPHPSALGRAVAWPVVLVVHWRMAARRPAHDTEAPVYLLFGSAVGLVLTATGLRRLLATVLVGAYDRLFLTVLVTGGSTALRHAAIGAAVGAVVWWWYWFRHAVGAGRSTGRDAYVLLGGVLGGLVAAVIGAAQVLQRVLEWFFGDPGGAERADHFATVPGALATGAVGLTVWWYHRGVVADQTDRTRREVDRVHDYLAAAVGVVTTAVAITVAVTALLEAGAEGSELVRGSSVADTVVLAVTLLLVGAPVWAAFWRRAQRHAAEPAELRSVSRRVYLLVILGVAATVALVALVLLLLWFFEDLTRGELGSSTLRRIRVPAGLVLSSGAIAAYHAAVFRTDHRATAALAPPVRPAPAVAPVTTPVTLPPAARLGEIVLLSPADERDAAARELHRVFGVRVRSWHAEPTVTGVAGAAPPDVAVLAAAVRDAVERVPEAVRVVVWHRPDGSVDAVAVVTDPDAATPAG